MDTNYLSTTGIFSNFKTSYFSSSALSNYIGESKFGRIMKMVSKSNDECLLGDNCPSNQVENDVSIKLWTIVLLFGNLNIKFIFTLFPVVGVMN